MPASSTLSSSALPLPPEPASTIAELGAAGDIAGARVCTDVDGRSVAAAAPEGSLVVGVGVGLSVVGNGALEGSTVDGVVEGWGLAGDDVLGSGDGTKEGPEVVGAEVMGAEVVTAEVVRSKLVGVNVVSAELVGSKLVGAEVVGAEMEEARDGAGFVGAKVPGN